MSERDQAIAAAYRDGGSLRSVAQTFSLSHEGVRLVLKREGVPVRGWGMRGWTDEQRAKHAEHARLHPPKKRGASAESVRAVQLVREGYSYGMAAKEVGGGMTRNAVAGACHRAGVKVNGLSEHRLKKGRRAQALSS